MIESTLIWWIAAAVGVLGSAICSATEISLYLVNRVRLNLRAAQRQEDGHAADRRAHWLRTEVERPDRALATLLIANTIFNNLGALGMSGLLEIAGFSDAQIITITALALTPTLFIFAETLPKELARTEPDRLAYRLVVPLRFARFLLTGALLVPAVMLFVRLINRLAHDPRDLAFRSARGRIASLLKEGAAFGVLSESQVSLIDRALAMRGVTIRDEMVPWRQVETIPDSLPPERLWARIEASRHARFPVVDARGRVTGILDAMSFCLAPKEPPAQHTITPLRLAPDVPVREALSRMTTSGARMAVVEERGRSLGIITTKDLVEPLTGELAAW